MGKLTLLVTSLIFIAMLATGMFSFLGDLQNTYGFNTTNEYGNVSRVLNVTTISGDINQSVEDLDNETGSIFNTKNSFFSFVDTAITNLGSVINAFKVTADIGTNSVNAASDAMHLPEWVAPALIIVIVLFVVFLVASYFTGRNF